LAITSPQGGDPEGAVKVNKGTPRLIEVATQHTILTIYAYREFVTAGGLMSYGGNLRDM
jgi:hypothetical protein